MDPRNPMRPVVAARTRQSSSVIASSARRVEATGLRPRRHQMLGWMMCSAAHSHRRLTIHRGACAP